MSGQARAFWLLLAGTLVLVILGLRAIFRMMGR